MALITSDSCRRRPCQVVALGVSNFIYFYANSAIKLVIRSRAAAVRSPLLPSTLSRG